MTTILAVDTSTVACSVALQVGSHSIAKYSNEPRSHSRLVMTMVQDILSEAGLKLNQLEAIGVTIGPGSFTGLRIGFATVQGLAYGAGVPVVPVSTLRLMVATYLRKYCSNPTLAKGREIIAVLDARMSEYSVGRYGLNGDGEVVVLQNDQLVSAEQALSLAASGDPLAIIGEADQLVETRPELAALYKQVYPQAEDILPIAQTEYKQGNAVPVTEVDLVYLRGAEAWQKRKRLREA